MKSKDVTLHPADELGQIRAQIAQLRSQEKKIEEGLIKKGPGRDTGGVLFDVNVVVFDRDNVSWKTVAEKAGASHQLISAHTSRSTVVRVDVTAKITQKGA